MILSEQGYPKDDQILARIDYFRGIASEGGIFIIGRDSNGREYKPKQGDGKRSLYKLPSDINFSVPIEVNSASNYPAIYFPFQLDSSRWQPKIIDNTLEKQSFDEEFFKKFDLTLMNESMQTIKLQGELESIFKQFAVYGAYELKGLVSNHFWGEMYKRRNTILEKFLDQYRN